MHAFYMEYPNRLERFTVYRMIMSKMLEEHKKYPMKNENLIIVDLTIKSTKISFLLTTLESLNYFLNYRMIYIQ